MDRLFHRHALRHLDIDLINRIEANGPQGRKPKPAGRSGKTPRPGYSYRQNGGRSSLSVRWRGNEDARIGGPFLGPIFLNRSSNWKHANTYQGARDLSPSSEAVR